MVLYFCKGTGGFSGAWSAVRLGVSGLAGNINRGATNYDWRRPSLLSQLPLETPLPPSLSPSPTPPIQSIQEACFLLLFSAIFHAFLSSAFVWVMVVYSNGLPPPSPSLPSLWIQGCAVYDRKTCRQMENKAHVTSPRSVAMTIEFLSVRAKWTLLRWCGFFGEKLTSSCENGGHFPAHNLTLPHTCTHTRMHRRVRTHTHTPTHSGTLV